MNHQPSFGEPECNGKKRRTSRDQFLYPMEQQIPWEELCLKFVVSNPSK